MSQLDAGRRENEYVVNRAYMEEREDLRIVTGTPRSQQHQHQSH